MKTAALLALLPLASAFVPPATRVNTHTASRGRTMSMATYKWEAEPGGVKFFPQSPPYWDPLGLSEDGDKDHMWRLQNGEIKNGRVAMLACLDYLVKGVGYKFPFEFNGVSTADIPSGLGALKALPLFGWIQLALVVGMFDIATDPNAGNPLVGKVPGNQQPDTPMFKAPGDLTIRAKEINNGRLAMMAIFGIWAGELVTGGQQPLEILSQKLGL